MPLPATFATAADLGVFLQTAGADPSIGNSDELNVYAAQLAVEAATGDIQAEAGWSVLQETVTGQTLQGWETTGMIFLPTLHVTSVALTYAGTLMAGSTFTWDAGGSLTLQPAFYPWNPYTPPTLTVTYTHGWAVPPAPLRSLCLDLAAAKYDNATRLAASSNTGTYDTWRPEISLRDDWRLDPFRLVLVG